MTLVPRLQKTLKVISLFMCAVKKQKKKMQRYI